MKKIIVLSLFLFFSFSALAATCSSAAPSTNSTTADFSATPVSGVAPLTVYFTDLSTGNPAIQSWTWDFGDGTAKLYVENPVHTYNNSGTYAVKLTVQNTAGSSTATKSGYIKVNNSVTFPVASFSASPTSGTVPLTVTFTDTSTGSPSSWLWNFGDGSTSNSQSTSHIYTSAGNYTVTLTATNTAGSSVSSSTINVSAVSAVVADFNASITSGQAPLTVQFFDISTGNPTTWYWDFGDGTNSTINNPSHTYQTTGTYTVSLMASSGTATGVATKTNYIIIENGLMAAFSASPTQGSSPLTVQFLDASIGSPTLWLWDFGDGNNSTLQNPVYIYTQDGNYTVALTVSNNISSNTTIAASFINVSSENTLIAGFSSNVTSGDAPLTVEFNDTSSGSPTAWLWDFGDGNNSTSQNSTYTYTEPGTYSVSLQASTASGQSVLTMPDYITVNDDSDSSSDSSSSSSSSSGSLATSVGSPEPASNVEVTLQAPRYVAAGNHIKFEFAKGATCIDYVEFDAKKTLGKITTTIEQLLDISVLTPNPPIGNVYKYVNIWVGNNGLATPGNIGNASIGFTINKANTSLNETEASTVVLQRYEDGEWHLQKTNKTGEDEQYIYFQANTTGFSSFAITSGETNEMNLTQVDTNMSKTKPIQYHEPNIESNQDPKTGTSTDWH